MSLPQSVHYWARICVSLSFSHRTACLLVQTFGMLCRVCTCVSLLWAQFSPNVSDSEGHGSVLQFLYCVSTACQTFDVILFDKCPLAKASKQASLLWSEQSVKACLACTWHASAAYFLLFYDSLCLFDGFGVHTRWHPRNQVLNLHQFVRNAGSVSNIACQVSKRPPNLVPEVSGGAWSYKLGWIFVTVGVHR